MNKTSKGLAIASMIMGILAVVLFSTIILTIIFGSLAVIFALLSRGVAKGFPPFSRTGLITGGLSIIVAFGIIISLYINMVNNPDFKQLLNETYQSRYGISFEEYTELLHDSIVNGDEESMNKLYEVIY